MKYLIVWNKNNPPGLARGALRSSNMITTLLYMTPTVAHIRLTYTGVRSSSRAGKCTESHRREPAKHLTGGQASLIPDPLIRPCRFDHRNWHLILRLKPWNRSQTRYVVPPRIPIQGSALNWWLLLGGRDHEGSLHSTVCM